MVCQFSRWGLPLLYCERYKIISQQNKYLEDCLSTISLFACRTASVQLLIGRFLFGKSCLVGDIIMYLNNTGFWAGLLYSIL